MKKFKIWLIHLLGGVTVEESKNSGKGYYRIGMLFTLADLKHYAESLNGKSADEWCKLMYEYICGRKEILTHGTDEERPTAHP